MSERKYPYCKVDPDSFHQMQRKIDPCYHFPYVKLPRLRDLAHKPLKSKHQHSHWDPNGKRNSSKEKSLSVSTSQNIVTPIPTSTVSSVSKSSGKLKQYIGSTSFDSEIAPNRLKCTQCTQTFPNQLSKNNHTKSHGDKYPCEQCHSSFNCLEALKRHSRLIHPDGTMFLLKRNYSYCTICSIQFNTRQVYNTHLRLVHADNNQNIKVSQYSQDQIWHSGSSEKVFFTCPICKELSDSKKSLRSHYKSHPIHQRTNIRKTIPAITSVINGNMTAFRCSKCSQMFWAFNRFKKHERTHGNKFPCQFCPNGFNYKRSLQYHNLRFHAEKCKSFDCTLCDHVVSTREGLSRHLRSVHSKHVKQTTVSKIITLSTKAKENDESNQSAQSCSKIKVKPLSPDPVPRHTIPKVQQQGDKLQRRWPWVHSKDKGQNLQNNDLLSDPLISWVKNTKFYKLSQSI